MPIAQARVGNIRNPRLDTSAQRLQLEFIQSLNRAMLEREQIHPGVDGVIESYELAFRMQRALPGVMDLASEPAATRGLYGLDDPVTADFGHQCLLAAALCRGRRPLRRADPRRLGSAPRPQGRPPPQRPGLSTGQSPAC